MLGANAVAEGLLYFEGTPGGLCGFVYFCMFRRPLLCSLNEVWRLMEHLKRKRYPVVCCSKAGTPQQILSRERG